MATTKTTQKKAPSKSKAPRAKGKENAASTAALQAAKKKGAALQAAKKKGKENAASTAALQAAKKKNQLTKDSGLGMSYHGLNDSSTPMSRHLLSMPRIPHRFDQYEHP
jgi:pyruvate/2-oxoglutarate dehydrogenase complex dihydrolipoamide acyltransferase (E2) component